MSGAHPLRRHAGPRAPRNVTKAVVTRMTVDGRRVARKSAEAGWLQRYGPAAWLLRRERRVLGALQHLGCVPRLVSAGPARLDVAWVDGEHLKERGSRGISEREAEGALAALAELHAAGWGHGDLGPRDILVREDGTVVLLDFATALGPAHPPLVGGLLARLWQRRDRRRMARLVRRTRRRHAQRAARLAARRAARRG